MSLFGNSGSRCGCNCCSNNNCVCDNTCTCNNNCTCEKTCTCTCEETCSCDNTCNCNNNCTCGETCECGNTTDNTCTCTCTCTCTPTTTVAGTETVVEKETVRALLTTVIDSCCATDDVCREISFCCNDLFPADRLEIGSVIDVDLAGDVTFSEVNRRKDDCVCVSTVRYNIPVKIYGLGNCGCVPFITQDIPVIRSAKLCCTASSTLTTYNSAVIALSAVVTDICCDKVTITLCILFRSCLQQTMIREYTWEATPVCITDNCNDTRNSRLDPCDTFCGCSAAGKKCPSC